MKKLFTFFVLCIITVGAVFLWWQNGLSATDKNNTTQEIFVIEEGVGVREIANKLKKQNLIKDPIVFFLLVKQKGIDKKIQAGDFRLAPSMGALQIAEELTHGTLDVWITIPEGRRAEEIAEILEARISTYEDSWIEELKKHEGYLFPETYLIPKQATIGLIVDKLTTTFEEKYKTLENPHNYAKERVVIVASLIEREARLDNDRPIIASVIYNRLGIGMKLDIDATLQYMLGYQEDEKRWWKKGLTNEDKKISSAYNTYMRAGLPPTPIANPGLAALKAALNPANTNYLYYITDKDGVNRYAEDFEAHEANIERYGL